MIWEVQLLELDGSADNDDEELDGYPSLFVGPALRAARLRVGVRQSEIARYLGVDSSLPSRWEGYDTQHDGQTTRYKPVPGKYFEPLASLLHCAVTDLAPELGLADEPVWNGSNGTTSASMSQMSGGKVHSGTISGYTLGGFSFGNLPTPGPGRPPSELQATGQWRRKCPGCRKIFLESLTARAPFVCDSCHTPVRAHTSITVTLSVTLSS